MSKISKEQVDAEIDEMFPIQVGQTYFCNGQEVLVLESATDNGVEGFKVSPTQSNEVFFTPKGTLKTKAELESENKG